MSKEICPFCGLDPYEYVDVGVGVIAVAVNCCNEGQLLIEHGIDVRLDPDYEKQEKTSKRLPEYDDDDIPF